MKHSYFEEASDDGSNIGGVGQSEVNQASENKEVTWPDNWRELYAGEDNNKLSRLSRYASPTAALDAMIAAQNKISSGEYKQSTPFPEKGTAEEQAIWRSNNSIPEAADKYDLSFENGLVIGEDDKPIIDDFLSVAHQANMPENMVKAAVQWYYDNQEKQEEAQYERDEQAREAGEDELRAEWGQEFKANINRIHGLLDTASEGVKDKFINARLTDGTPLASNPDVLRFLADMALQINPAVTLVPGAGDNLAGSISDEISNLEKMMGDRSSDYWKGPKSEELQKRYRDLIAARDKMAR